VRINPIPMLIDLIRDTPGLGPVLVSNDLMSHVIGDAAIIVQLEPGSRRVVRDRMDAFRFTLNHYGGSTKEASDQAFLVREYLLEQAPGSIIGNVAIDEVREDDAPWDFDDRESREQRFVHRIIIYLYEV